MADKILKLMLVPFNVMKGLILSFAFYFGMMIRIALINKGNSTRIYHDVFVKYPRNITIGKNTFVNQGCIFGRPQHEKSLSETTCCFGRVFQ